MDENISLPGDGFIKIDTVVHCSGGDTSSTLFLNNGNVLTVNESIDSMEEKLPAHRFVRLNPIRIVNIDFANRYVKGPPAYVVLYDGTKIFVAPAWEKRYDKLLNSL